MAITVLLLLVLVIVLVGGEDNQKNDEYVCDDNGMSDKIPLSLLTPNTFYKICPSEGVTSQGFVLGQPTCGDGTPFSFYVSRPPQRKANNDRILIEFMGGGACWDQETCNQMQDYLTFPDQFDDFVGLSCSEIHYGTQQQDGYPISMLCGQKLADKTDLTRYNTIIVPYCTQDVHIGSSNIQYSNNNNNNNNEGGEENDREQQDNKNGDGSTIYHHGGHNLMAVLRWIFTNFPNPHHIALTGCSAGGTVLPVAYDYLNKHYNRLGSRSVQINVITDSPVYLTPSYFLLYALDNWNPWPVIQRMGFNYRKWRYDTDYPTRVWDHVLRRGSNEDRWGFVSHTNDEVSQTYYEWMSGNQENRYLAQQRQDDKTRSYSVNPANHYLFQQLPQRSLEQNGNDQGSEWWSELSTSIETITSKHSNVESFFIESDGHCSFGLYYALQEDGFAEWAGSIFAEDRLIRGSPAVALFVLASLSGALLWIGAATARLKSKQHIAVDDEELLEKQKGRSLYCLVACTAPFQKVPVTAAYALALSIYFWTMIIVVGFAHPLNNPSLGPKAVDLSRFGINNPSLIVYKWQIHRIITSNLLCSGIIAYLIVLLYLWNIVRHIESALQKPIRFALIALLIALGANLTYALVGNGASCASVALVFGFTPFYLAMRRSQGTSAWCATFTAVLMFIIVSVLLPFNSWIMLLAAFGFGAIVANGIVAMSPTDARDAEDGELHMVLRKTPLFILMCTYCAMAFVIVSRIRSPNKLYLQPFYTGCDLMVVEGEDLAAAAGNFYNADRRRRLHDQNGIDDNMCAQFCVPHLVSRGVTYGAQRLLGLGLVRGTCDMLGYDEYMADKTFKQMSYALDVEIFVQSNDDDNNGGGGGGGGGD